MIMPSLFCEEFDLLPNVRSLALQIYSNMDDAGSHCNMGNMKLALDTMIRWMDQMDDKNGTGIAAGKPGKRENLNLGDKEGKYSKALQ